MQSEDTFSSVYVKITQAIKIEKNKNKNGSRFLILQTTLMLGFSLSSHAHKDATGIVKERIDFFKKSQQDIKALYF